MRPRSVLVNIFLVRHKSSTETKKSVSLLRIANSANPLANFGLLSLYRNFGKLKEKLSFPILGITSPSLDNAFASLVSDEKETANAIPRVLAHENSFIFRYATAVRCTCQDGLCVTKDRDFAYFCSMRDIIKEETEPVAFREICQLGLKNLADLGSICL
jgi:hypothetical protein